MKAEQFYQIWEEFVNEHAKHKDIWKFSSIADRTVELIGEKESSGSKSPFGNFLKKKYDDYEYRTEDGLVDLDIFKKNDYFQKVCNLYSPHDSKYTIIPYLIDYPKFYDILIEHENDPRLCYQEMTKLTTFRGKLKVLITYNWDKAVREDYGYVYDTLSRNFKEIIDQANQFCKETDTEYLLIIGQYEPVESVIWKHYIFKP